MNYLFILATVGLMLVAFVPYARAGSGVSLDVADSGTHAALSRNGSALAVGTAKPLFSVLYSDSASIWDAQTWRELTCDAPTVRRRGASTTVSIVSFGGKPIHLRAIGRVDDEHGEVVWRLVVENHAPGTVVGVSGPALAGIREVPGGTLYVPDRPGQRLSDPWNALAAAPRRIEYPVPASMQFITYAGAQGGVALHVRDPEMVYKEFSFGGPDREMNPTQYPFVAPGGRWTSPPIVWQALKGDWHSAADSYRRWYRSWAPTPHISPQVRRYPVMGGTVVRSRPVDDANLQDVMKRQETGTYAAALKEALRLKQAGYDGTHLVGWFGQGHDTTYPDHLPSAEMGGESGLKDLISGMHRSGMIATLYLNARLANLDSPTLRTHPDWELKMRAGEVYRERYGDRSFTLLCPAVAGWQTHLTGEALRVARDYGGDGVQLDQVGAAWSKLCFDRTHGHRTPATAWGEGYPVMLKSVHTATRSTSPAFWDWIEGAWEGAGPYIDASQGGYWPDLPGAVMFPQLYRYTLPEHPMFGDARMGGIPFWCPTDIHRAARINAAAGAIFQTGRFMDDLSLTCSPSAECHWFGAGRSLVITVTNDYAEPRLIEVHLLSAGAGHSSTPRRARALASGDAVRFHMDASALVGAVEVPAGQVEAVRLDW